MAKTTKSQTARFNKVEVQVTAAIVAATSLVTAEWIDISSIFAGPLEEPQLATADVQETPVSGDSTPITSRGSLTARQLSFSILYTEGETLGTDTIDIYQDLLKPVHEATSPLSMPVRYSIPGGNTGDNQYVTDTNESWMLSLTDPVGPVNSDKVMITFVISTPTLTPSTL